MFKKLFGFKETNAARSVDRACGTAVCTFLGVHRVE